MSFDMPWAGANKQNAAQDRQNDSRNYRRHWLTQAIGNIWDNAIQFSPADTEICINVESAGEELSISVADNGIGMSEENIPIAGEAFRQVDGGLSRKVDGLGVGLTISRMFVELHGGRLKIDSSPGLGTTVRMTIPHGGWSGETQSRL